MANIKQKQKDVYIPPKAGNAYPQLQPTTDYGNCSAKLTDDEYDVDTATKQRKFLRFTVQEGKALCMTVLGLDDAEAADNYLVVDQIFGDPGCESRKPLAGIVFTPEECQIVFKKPGRYELRDDTFDLFAKSLDIKQRNITLETAALLCASGAASYV